MDKPAITGEWIPADDTPHHLRVAETDVTAPNGDPVYALSSTNSEWGEPALPAYATRGQFLALMNSAQSGRLARILGGSAKGKIF